MVRDEEEVDDGQEEQVDEESGVLQIILKTVFSVIGDASAEYVSIDLVPEIVSPNYHLWNLSFSIWLASGNSHKFIHWKPKAELQAIQGCFMYGWVLGPCPLIKSPLYLPWLFIFWVSNEKLVTSQVYKND